MKTEGMNEDKVNEVIVTFADYVENYFGKDNDIGDIPILVNEHFDEFIDWAYEDLLLDEEDQVVLRGTLDPEYRNSIKKEVVQEFMMIVRLRRGKLLAAEKMTNHSPGF